MKDENYWELCIRNVTELEFESLMSACSEVATKNKWSHLFKGTDRDFDDLEEDLSSAHSEIEDLQRELDDALANQFNVRKVIEMLESGDSDGAIKFLEEYL